MARRYLHAPCPAAGDRAPGPPPGQGAGRTKHGRTLRVGSARVKNRFRGDGAGRTRAPFPPGHAPPPACCVASTGLLGTHPVAVAGTRRAREGIATSVLGASGARCRRAGRRARCRQSLWPACLMAVGAGRRSRSMRPRRVARVIQRTPAARSWGVGAGIVRATGLASPRLPQRENIQMWRCPARFLLDTPRSPTAPHWCRLMASAIGEAYERSRTHGGPSPTSFATAHRSRGRVAKPGIFVRRPPSYRTHSIRTQQQGRERWQETGCFAGRERSQH